MDIYETFHYSGFLGLFVVFIVYKKPPAFGAALAFWCILLSFLGLLFCHLSNNLSNYNVLTANAPFFYKISGTWSNHEGSILLWCWILCFFGCLLCYRARALSHIVSKRCCRCTLFLDSIVSKKSILSSFECSGTHKWYTTTTLLEMLLDYELPRRMGPALSVSTYYPDRKSVAAIGETSSRGSPRDRTTLPFMRDDKASTIEAIMGMALFFIPFHSASSDPFVRNFLVRTEPLSESNPVPQDPISAIHPPCIYAGDVASAMGYCCFRSQIRKGMVVELQDPPIRSDAEKKGTLLRAGCVGSSHRKCIFSLINKISANAKSDPALLCRRCSWLNTHSGFLRGAETRERKGNTHHTSFPCWTEANTVVSDLSPIRIWILTCWWFLTVGILLGSWWAYHELGWGGWWFWDPVENASFIPWVLATALMHSGILPLHSWTSFLNIVTLLCCLLGTYSIRSGLLAPVHSFSKADTRGLLLLGFFLLLTGISSMLVYHMKLLASVRITYQKEMVLARSTLLHLRN